MNFDRNGAVALKVFAPSRDHPSLSSVADPVPLVQALAMADRAFGLDRLLSDEGSEIVAPYYRQSLPGYATIYNRWQCMHVPLLAEGDSEERGYFAQATAVSEILNDRPGQRVLELGCGLGANSLHLAAHHPEVDFVGLDLMAEHVKRAGAKAATLPNLRFHQGSFEALPDSPAELGGLFDVIFAVETLCYARDLDRVAAGIARLLRPGGRLVIFDAQRREGFDNYPAALVTAARLYEITTAVTHGFHPDGAWEQALARAGLPADSTRDMTAATYRGLLTLHRRALKAFTDRKWLLALRMMPRYLARNSVAGLLGYHVCFGAGLRPDSGSGPIVYQKIIARKPLG